MFNVHEQIMNGGMLDLVCEILPHMRYLKYFISHTSINFHIVFALFITIICRIEFMTIVTFYMKQFKVESY